MASSPRLIVLAFWKIARGSALECAACLDVLAVRKLLLLNGSFLPRKARPNREHAHGNAEEIFLDERSSCVKTKDLYAIDQEHEQE